VLSSNLALNMENRMRQLINVLNVSARSKVYVIAGDVDRSGRISVSIATPRRKP